MILTSSMPSTRELQVISSSKTLAERTTESAHLTAREVDVLRLLGNGD
jgi:DNA-binding NarL/FixJ family response regulator